jgi:pimeloyl-ACP methyl ester carboxylesterase
MKRRVAGLFAISVVLALVSSPLAQAEAGPVHARFDLESLQGAPFPSNGFTVPDSTQNTGLRVELPRPDCAARPSDCSDIGVLNELDGFNLQPRLSIPFDGPIDVESVTSQSVFLVSLGSTLPGGDPGGQVVGIDQVVWDTFTNALYVESDDLLDQHTRYVLVVTDSVLDASGKHVKAGREFLELVDNENGGSTDDPALDAYRTSLREALIQIDEAGIVPLDQVVAASVFTTQSVTAVLEKIRDQIKAASPDPADFLLGADGSRTVFERSTVAKVWFNRQTSADPAAPLADRQQLVISVLDIVPGAVGTIAFGRYSSPDYRAHPGEIIPPVGTLSDTPPVRGMNDITFLLLLPSRPQPAGGYPVAIFAHGGGTGSKVGSGLVAAKLAEQGVATIAIDAPGFGFGPLSTYTIERTDSSTVRLLSGGRGIAQNGDGNIENGEGFDAAPPRTLLDGRDGYRQETADLMQLVREIEVGVDVDGDGGRDLDPSRINFVGVSRGGIQGAMLLALEPSLQAGVLTSGNAGSVEYARLAVVRGGFLGPLLQSRVPSLINSHGITSIDGIPLTPPPFFNENLPLRDGASFRVVLEGGSTQEIRSPVKNIVPGAVEIQQVLDNSEWARQSASAVAYAPYIRRTPLPGMSSKSVIIQFANGDRQAPNPEVTAVLRAGDLADRATFVRTNLLFHFNPIPGNSYPHDFMVGAVVNPNTDVKNIALKAQQQIATFFASDGTLVIDPDDVAPALSVPTPIFDVPIVLPLPEATNYFP